jgi:acyl-CoA hydrolase
MLREFPTFRLVKSEDLNHHGTLYAGRSAEWFVESGFIAAYAFVNPKNII